MGAGKKAFVRGFQQSFLPAYLLGSRQQGVRQLQEKRSQEEERRFQSQQKMRKEEFESQRKLKERELDIVEGRASQEQAARDAEKAQQKAERMAIETYSAIMDAQFKSEYDTLIQNGYSKGDAQLGAIRSTIQDARAGLLGAGLDPKQVESFLRGALDIQKQIEDTADSVSGVVSGLSVFPSIPTIDFADVESGFQQAEAAPDAEVAPPNQAAPETAGSIPFGGRPPFGMKAFSPLGIELRPGFKPVGPPENPMAPRMGPEGDVINPMWDIGAHPASSFQGFEGLMQSPLMQERQGPPSPGPMGQPGPGAQPSPPISEPIGGQQQQNFLSPIGGGPDIRFLNEQLQQIEARRAAGISGEDTMAEELRANILEQFLNGVV